MKIAVKQRLFSVANTAEIIAALVVPKQVLIAQWWLLSSTATWTSAVTTMPNVPLQSVFNHTKRRPKS
jgi:hypothetical protein